MFDQIHKTADFEESIFVQRQKMYSFKQEISRQLPMACNRPYPIEIINNTRGSIEGEIWERDDWGANSCPGCSPIHDFPDKKSRFRWVFLLFKLFFGVKILKISLQIV